MGPNIALPLDRVQKTINHAGEHHTAIPLSFLPFCRTIPTLFLLDINTFNTGV